MKIEPGSYTDQKMKHQQWVDKMKADGWVLGKKPMTWNPGAKWGGPMTSLTNVWVRTNPKTGKKETCPFIGFI